MPRLTRFFLSATSTPPPPLTTPPSFSFLSPRFPFFPPQRRKALRNLQEFLRLESISRRGFSNSATRFFSSFFSLSLFRSVFLPQLFPFDTGESRIGRNALSAIVGYSSPSLSPEIVRGKLCFFFYNCRNKMEVEEKGEAFNTSALLLM